MECIEPRSSWRSPSTATAGARSLAWTLAPRPLGGRDRLDRVPAQAGGARLARRQSRIRQGAVRHLAALPAALHARRAGSRRQAGPSRRCQWRQVSDQLPAQGAQARDPEGRGRDRRPGVHELPQGPPDEDPLHQSADVSTARSSVAPSSSASSPTRRPSPAWSAPSSWSRTTSGPCSAPARWLWKRWCHWATIRSSSYPPGLPNHTG